MSGISVLAKRLKDARLRAGLSQKELGILAGMDQFSASSRVNQYERGKHIPDLLTAERLANILGIPTPFLYARDDLLANWILAFSIVSPALRQSIFRRARLPTS
jgi:transcriptional regulator with XRE-family HTH domain